MKLLDSLIWHAKYFLRIQPNMEEIKNYIREQILKQTPAFETEIFTLKLPRMSDNRERLIIHCHYQDEEVKLLDLFSQGQLYRVNDVERVKKFARINAAITLFIAHPFFVNHPCFESIATGFFLLYPTQSDNRAVRFHNTFINLDEMKSKKLEHYKNMFPYFVEEGTQIDNLFPKYYHHKQKRLNEYCCD